MNIQLHFSLTATEYTNLMRYLMNWRRYAWMAGAVLLLVAIQFFINGAMALLYLLVFALLGVFMYFAVLRSIRKGFELATDLQGPLHYQITDADFRVTTDSSDTTYQWTSFQSAREVPEWFLLRQNDRLYNFVPKRAFNSPAEIEEFRKFLKTRGLLKNMEKSGGSSEA